MGVLGRTSGGLCSGVTENVGRLWAGVSLGQGDLKGPSNQKTFAKRSLGAGEAPAVENISLLSLEDSFRIPASMVGGSQAARNSVYSLALGHLCTFTLALTHK